MSIEPKSATTTNPLGADPLADVRDGQVLRCAESETGWQWFYARDGAQILKFHEADGYQPEPTPARVVAATVALADVVSYAVSETYLDVYARGEV
ncbi:hypothetical protein [Halomontanus rarus]|uniref:hypothetical protein n=1 Tax=Halomontanus rarus TaxID=3034020 RepID=UPI00307C2882